MIRVNEISSKRFRFALKMFEEGRSFTYGNVNFWIDPSTNVLEVSHEIEYTETLSVSRAKALIGDSKRVFEFLKDGCESFRTLVEGLSVRYSISAFNGVATMEIAFETDEGIKWT